MRVTALQLHQLLFGLRIGGLLALLNAHLQRVTLLFQAVQQGAHIHRFYVERLSYYPRDCSFWRAWSATEGFLRNLHPFRFIHQRPLCFRFDCSFAPFSFVPGPNGWRIFVHVIVLAMLFSSLPPSRPSSSSCRGSTVLLFQRLTLHKSLVFFLGPASSLFVGVPFASFSHKSKTINNNWSIGGRIINDFQRGWTVKVPRRDVSGKVRAVQTQVAWENRWGDSFVFE